MLPPDDAAQPLPTGANVDTLKGIIKGWEDEIVWAGPGGTNIIYSTLTSDTACPKPKTHTGKRLYFANPSVMLYLCKSRTHPGCWISTGTLTEATGTRQTIMLRSALFSGVSWLAAIPAASNCTWLEWVLSHEVGHGYGLGHAKIENSIMSYASVNYGVCGPTIYDTAAILATYQSR